MVRFRTLWDRGVARREPNLRFIRVIVVQIFLSPNSSKEKDPDVIFLGDCILEALQFTDIWNSFFGPLHCLNFAIRNDKVENVLWRVENGTLDNVNPKVSTRTICISWAPLTQSWNPWLTFQVVVLHVGTLNTQHTVDQIVEGIEQIITNIRNKLPNTYIVFPVNNWKFLVSVEFTHWHFLLSESVTSRTHKEQTEGKKWTGERIAVRKI